MDWQTMAASIVSAIIGGSGVGAVVLALQKYRAQRIRSDLAVHTSVVSEYKELLASQQRQVSRLNTEVAEIRREGAIERREYIEKIVSMRREYGDDIKALQKDHMECLERSAQLEGEVRRMRAQLEDLNRDVNLSYRDAQVIVDSDGKIREWNTYATGIFGWSETEMLGHGLERLIPDDKLQLHREKFNEVASGSRLPKYGPKSPYSLDAVAKNGKSVPLWVRLSVWEEFGELRICASMRPRYLIEA